MHSSVSLLTLLFVLLTASFSQAQDIMERFYQPSKEWGSIEHLDYDFHSLEVDEDTVTYLELIPEGSALGSIIYYHGAGGNITRYLPMTTPMVAAGYRVFMIDFRGYGKSTGKPDHANVAHDAQVIFDQLLKRRDVRRGDVILYGASLGTQVATKIAVDNTRKVDALVLDGPMTSFTDIALEYAPEEHHSYIKMLVNSPYSAKEGVAQLDKLPLLVIHSREDEAIPFAMGEDVFAAKKGQRSMWIYQGEHLEAPVLFPEELLSRIDGMLK